MPRKTSNLSKQEWLLMNFCWDQGKSTARQIFDLAAEKRKWRYQTVKTMLDRLAVKGCLKREKLGPLCLYEPAIPRAKTIGQAIDSFLGAVLDNAVAPLFAHLAKGRTLTREEIDALKKLIDEQEEEKKR